MANDLQAQISADVSKALSGLDQVNNKLTQLQRATAGVGKANHEFQKSATKSFSEAKGVASEYFNELKHGGHALAMLGGPLGESAHRVGMLARIAGSGGMAMGALGVAATAAAVAFEILNHQLDANAERNKKAQEAAEKYAEAINKGKEKQGKDAVSGLSDADSIKKLTGLGGNKAMKQAEEIADKLGIPLQEARKGLISSYKLPEKDRAGAVDAAVMAAQSGVVNFDGAIGEAKGPALAAIRGGETTRAAALMSQHGSIGKYQGASADRMWGETENVNDSPFLKASRNAQREENNIQLNNESHADKAAEVISGGLSKALDPAVKAINDLTMAMMANASKIQDPKEQSRELDTIRDARVKALVDLGYSQTQKK